MLRLVPLVLVATLALTPSPAAACGGCFPTVGTPAPVNAHRMAVSLSATETTLWDQIVYDGSPDDFVWVLPVMGTPEIELADNAFFEALAQETQITMTSPLPPRAFCPGSGGFGCAADSAPAIRAADAAAFGDAGPVVVLAEEVVGPYETVTVSSPDPMALVTWLQDRGYGVDDSILPTIAYYGEMGANFLALRLAPDAGIDRMQPVRVTSPGLSLTFPLRMVAAGVQLDVSLELFVFAEGRMEAANYGNAMVDRDAITFDWATGTFDYEARFEDALFSGDGPGTNWVTEYARRPDVTSLASYERTDEMGVRHAARPDVEHATRYIPSPYLTRLRTRLPPSELDRDLLLRASILSVLGTDITVTREVNRAADVSCGGCSATPTLRVPFVAGAMLLAPLALVFRRRRR